MAATIEQLELQIEEFLMQILYLCTDKEEMEKKIQNGRRKKKLLDGFLFMASLWTLCNYVIL